MLSCLWMMRERATQGRRMHCGRRGQPHGVSDGGRLLLLCYLVSAWQCTMGTLVQGQVKSVCGVEDRLT